MPFGIDIFSDGMTCAGSGEHANCQWKDYGIIGLTPRQNEPIIWNNPRALRSSKQGPYLSLTDIWSQFMLNGRGDARYSWQRFDGLADELPAVNLIADAIKQNIPQSELRNTVIAIENNLNEFQQDALLKGLKMSGFTKAELLWRPIAICLYILNQAGRENFNEYDKIAIVDFDSYYPEITVLTLKYLHDELVPLRSLPKKENHEDAFDCQLGTGFNNYRLKRDFIASISTNRETEEQLKCGPFSGEFFAFMDSDNYGDCFIEQDLSYSKLNFENVWRNNIANHSLDEINFHTMRQKIRDLEEYNSADYTFWNGFPVRVQDSNIFSAEEILIDNKAVAEGAADYAQRRLEGRPTYLDTLPGLEIFSNLESGGYKFFLLIEKKEVEGGTKERIKEKMPGFKLDNTELFESVLRDITTQETKILRTPIPLHNYDYHVPLLIDAEMMPANGHAIVTIEGDADHINVFGRKKRIQLDWQSMDKYEIPDNYSGPEVYPVRGRIGDDEECRNIVREHVSNSARMYYSYTYRNRQVKYQDLHKPWGFLDPWGQKILEPTRAMFGAYIEEEDEIQVLSDGMSKLIYDFETDIKNRHKYLNYMFRYAPESFREELRNLYSSENPDLNWNTVYGVGRAFYKARDFELFVDFFLKKSEEYGYPAYPDGGYTDKYIWAFFRCLCYYEETNLIPLEKAEKVIECIIKFSAIPGSRKKQTVKFILSAVLFSLRFRTNGRAFLAAATQLRLDVEDLVQNTLPQIGYPPAMFADQREDTLNDFVYRFLTEEQTNEDIEALKGLITSMS